MPLVYCFAKARNKEAAEQIRSTTLTLLSKRGVPGDTWKHLCAELKADGAADVKDFRRRETFDCLLKFEYDALSDVARAVLANRVHFGDLLVQTLTLLQYPESEYPTLPARRPPWATFEKRGILLIREKLGLGPATAAAKESIERVSGRGTVSECIGVFGPFDYVVEITGINQVAELSKWRFEDCQWIDSCVRLGCEPIPPPGSVPPKTPAAPAKPGVSPAEPPSIIDKPNPDT